ncbi:MAG: acyl-CoA dehydrogenase [Dehalococcoidia bacterium]|nr:acyl-CoA dehydrogenase [Dehalococcoidia bacterium]
MTQDAAAAILHALQGQLPAMAERDQAAPELYPAANLAALREIGLPLAPFPAALGGSGLSLEDGVRVIEAVASASGSSALVLAMPLGLAGIFAAPVELAPPEHRARWQQQREWAAAEFRAGKLFAACNSEKGAGGSLDATRTVATLRDGTFLLTGEKILASGGRNAAYFFSTAKASPDELPGAGVVEFFFVPTSAPGVTVMDDWDGFGMRSTESHTVRYEAAPAAGYLGFPGFLTAVQPLQYFFCLFAAVPLGCVRGMLAAFTSPAPASPGVRLRLAEATMRYEAARAYLLDTARDWQYASPPDYRARVLRTKTYVTQECARIAADLFALGGGRNYRRESPVARAFADVFAGTALRPPLALALDQLADQFGA